MKKQTLGMLTVFVIALLLFIGALLLLNQKPREIVVTPVVTSEVRPLAIVNGQNIELEFWAEQYLLDQVLNHLAGQDPPLARSTLERLINESLLLQTYADVTQPANDTQVNAYIEMVLSAWEMDHVTLEQQLLAVGLPATVMTDTTRRLLQVSAAQTLLAEEADPANWLARERAGGGILINEDLFGNLEIPVISWDDTP